MKTNIKRKPLLFGIIFAVALLFAGFALAWLPTHGASIAEDNANIGRTYFRSELNNSPLALRFYDAMSYMANGGHLTDGQYEYDLIENNVVSAADVAEYASADKPSPKIPVALGAARDAFFMDNPDIFYVDTYKITLTVGMKNGNYVATLGTGRGDNYYTNDTVSSKADVDAAIVKYEAAIKEYVDGAKAAGSDVYEQIKYVNNKLASEVTYDNGAYNASHSGGEVDGFVYTSYGALVNKKALCQGYATAYKAILDRLGVPCVLIAGSACSGFAVEGEAGFEAHMWTAVNVDGLWYAVDPTWNSSCSSSLRYFLVGSDYLAASHVSDGVLSSSGFEVKYPAIRPLNYGVNEDASGFEYKDSGKIGEKEFGYSKVGNSHFLELGVSYENKNLVELRESGKHLAVRSKLESGWTGWMSIVAYLDFFLEGNGYNQAEAKEFWDSMCAEHFTHWSVTYDVEQVQFAVFDAAPEVGVEYSAAEANEHAIAIGSVYANEVYGDVDALPAPYVASLTPNEKGSIISNDPLPITIKYTEPLVKAEGHENEPVKISVTGKHSDLADRVKVENVEWDGDSTVKFIFTPSTSYSHNMEPCYFVPANLVGKNSGKTPAAASLSFQREYVVCPKVFNDGRMYMKVFGQPQFIGAEDMSLTDFKDKNGQPVAGNQRTQMMLVVSKPNETETESMVESAGLGSSLRSSATYDINLQLCGVIRKIPDGSYLQVGFGFPEGYGPDDKGVTFTVYHYTRNPDGTVKDVMEIPCVVSEFGIIATINSFSPFMVCAVEGAPKTSTRNVYASVNGVGGAIDKTTIKQVSTGGSVSYKITKEKGYALNKVLLNGKDITDAVTGDTLTVAYDALGKDDAKGNSDIIEITFVSERVAARNAANNVTVIEPKLVVTDSDMIIAAEPSVIIPNYNGGDDSNVGLIIAIVVIMIVLAAAAAIVTVVMLRKKKTATANGAAAEKKPVAKPAAPKTVAPTAEKTAVQRTAAPAAKPAPASNKTATPAQKPTANRTAAPAAKPTPAAQRPTPTANRTVTPAAKPAPTVNKPAAPAAKPAPTRTPPAKTAAPAAKKPVAAPTKKPTDKK